MLKNGARVNLSLLFSLSLDFIGAVRASEDFFDLVCSLFRAKTSRGGGIEEGKRAGEVFGNDASFFVEVSPSLKAIIFVLSMYFSLSLSSASVRGMVAYLTSLEFAFKFPSNSSNTRS